MHFHDIFLPREYPKVWLEQNWFWNEQYLLLAFLMYNKTFRTIMLNNHFLNIHTDVVAQALGKLDAGAPSSSSMWLVKSPS